MIVAPNTTSFRDTIFVYNDSGVGVTGLVAVTFPVVYYYPPNGVNRVAITLSNRGTLLGSYVSGSLYEIGDGAYSFDFPNAMFTIEGQVSLTGDATNKHILYPKIQVLGVMTEIEKIPKVGRATRHRRGTESLVVTLENP